MLSVFVGLAVFCAGASPPRAVSVLGYYHVFLAPTVRRSDVVDEQFAAIAQHLLPATTRLLVNVVHDGDSGQLQLPFAGANVDVRHWRRGFEELTIDRVGRVVVVVACVSRRS